MEKSKNKNSSSVLYLSKGNRKSSPSIMTLPRNNIFRPWDEAEKPTTCGSKHNNNNNNNAQERIQVADLPSTATTPAIKNCSSNKQSSSASSSTSSSHLGKSHGAQVSKKGSSRDKKGAAVVLDSVSKCSVVPPVSSFYSNNNNNYNNSYSNSNNSFPNYLKYEPCSSQGTMSEPNSPIDSPYQLNKDSTASNLFLYPVAINELANLSRNELTAIGLLPPEPPSSHKVKRQRPKRFHCPHCQVAFSNNGQLRGHIRIHTGERPFVCEQESCGKSFTRNEELTRHRRIHTGLRPFPCSVCGKKFGRKDHLKKHTRTHQRVMYAPSTMIGYGSPFQPFHPPIFSASSGAPNDLGLPSLSAVPPYGFSIIPSMAQSHYPPL